MQYVIRKIDTGNFVKEGPSYGPLGEAWVYPTLEQAQEELDDDGSEEIVPVRLITVDYDEFESGYRTNTVTG